MRCFQVCLAGWTLLQIVKCRLSAGRLKIDGFSDGQSCCCSWSHNKQPLWSLRVPYGIWDSISINVYVQLFSYLWMCSVCVPVCSLLVPLCSRSIYHPEISIKMGPCFAHAVGITTAGDDSNYGSAGVLDVLCLQALSKRIHYGKFVAEAKFRCASACLAPCPFFSGKRFLFTCAH